ALPLWSPVRGWRMSAWLRHILAMIPKVFVAGLLIVVMLDLLVGVLLRYVVVRITDYFDLDPISFFWVEEVGEFGLAWLTMIGAALAVIERTHFALAVFTHRFSAATQQLLERAG